MAELGSVFFLVGHHWRAASSSEPAAFSDPIHRNDQNFLGIYGWISLEYMGESQSQCLM